MWTKCFGCQTVIEGDDSDTIVERFLAHARDSHDWSYPEEAIGNYAANFAEATGRLTGGAERLPEIGEIEIHPVTEDRIDDWLEFFDRHGFVGNPDWASCYCIEPHDPTPPEMPERPWRENRSAMVQRLRDGGAFGYLAYVGDRPAGWVNASLLSDYAHHQLVDPGDLDPSSVIGVSCFVIAPPYRRHGVAAALLARVVADAAARNASWIEGFPRNQPEESDADHFRGPRSLYDAYGFEPVGPREATTVVRRPAP